MALPVLSADCPERKGNITRSPSGNWQIHLEWKMLWSSEKKYQPPPSPFHPDSSQPSQEHPGMSRNHCCLLGWEGAKTHRFSMGLSSILFGINTFKWGIKASLSSQGWRCAYFQPHFPDLLELLLQLRAQMGELQTKEKQVQDCHCIYIYH